VSIVTGVETNRADFSAIFDIKFEKSSTTYGISTLPIEHWLAQCK
jgi:hypothetical protein